MNPWQDPIPPYAGLVQANDPLTELTDRIDAAVVAYGGAVTWPRRVRTIIDTLASCEQLPHDGWQTTGVTERVAGLLLVGAPESGAPGTIAEVAAGALLTLLREEPDQIARRRLVPKLTYGVLAAFGGPDRLAVVDGDRGGGCS